MINVSLTPVEASWLKTVVEDKVRDGSYYGNKAQWDKRMQRILSALEDALEAEDKRQRQASKDMICRAAKRVIESMQHGGKNV